MEGQLSRIDGDWENCSEGVFSFLRRDAPFFYADSFRHCGGCGKGCLGAAGG
jgi:hypothetical protein